MSRKCTVCGRYFDKEDVDKDWMYKSNLCSKQCVKVYKSKDYKIRKDYFDIDEIQLLNKIKGD